MIFSLFSQFFHKSLGKQKMSQSKTDIDSIKKEQNPGRLIHTKNDIPSSSHTKKDVPSSSPLTVSSTPKSWQSRRISQSIRAGLKMPVGRIHKTLKKGNFAPRVRPDAAVYLTAVLEYLAGEMLELAAQAAKNNRKIRISPRYLLLAIRHDVELNNIIDKTFLAEGCAPRAQTKSSPKKTYRRTRNK